MLENFRPLTQDQRKSAHRAACQAAVQALGPKPARDHFSSTTISRYPSSVTRLITTLCLVLLMAAFTLSAIRLYVIGSQAFGQAVPNVVATTAVGIATVLSAEIGQVVFSLALATLGTSTTSRRLLYVSMGMCTAVALAGNIQVALLGHEQSVFAWLEAVVPPLVVLSTAYVLKGQLLETSDRRRERRCVVCATVLPEPSPLGGRRRFYCSNACRQRAKRRRMRQE
ncbi:MAG: hypothetical protein GX601_12450 [Anaerolineales bacterium]|nr:hypothetical protein [Anaerolineales bacterium]